MDCASYAGKIQTALAKLPGITDVRAPVMTETLKATLNQTRTSVEEIKKRVAGLGYTLTRKRPPISNRDAGSEEPGHSHADTWLGGHEHEPASGTRATRPTAHTRAGREPRSTLVAGHQG